MKKLEVIDFIKSNKENCYCVARYINGSYEDKEREKLKEFIDAGAKMISIEEEGYSLGKKYLSLAKMNSQLIICSSLFQLGNNLYLINKLLRQLFESNCDVYVEDLDETLRDINFNFADMINFQHLLTTQLYKEKATYFKNVLYDKRVLVEISSVNFKNIVCEYENNLISKDKAAEILNMSSMRFGRLLYYYYDLLDLKEEEKI